MTSSFSSQIWRPRTSVKLRFALAQGVFIALIIALLAVTLYVPVQKYFKDITDSSYAILADNLSAGIYTDYVNRQDTTAQANITRTVRRVQGRQGVKYVLIIDQNNIVYYDTETGEASLEGKQYIDAITAKVEKSNGNLVKDKVTRDGVAYYNYASPFLNNRQVLYTVRLGVDVQSIDGQFNRFAQLFIYMGLLGIIIGILAAYFLASRLTRPIIKLTESALAIRAGNLNAYPEIATNDELEQLSREFQSMVEKLKQFYFQEYTQKKEAINAKHRVEEINARLEELDRQKTDFLNAASHQLRTPLSIIHWSLSLIVDEAPHLNLPKEQQELLEESLKSTKRMVDLVNDLLDISRIEQGRSNLDWAMGNFGKVCEQLVAALQPLAKNKNLQLTYEQTGTIPDSFLDEKKFYQVVNNFVDNAIKYTSEGWVTVTAGQDGNMIAIRISDSGIGMTEEEQQRLFTRFSRGSEASKMFANGSGLGMFVAKTILSQHGGEVEVQSEKGRGTTFTLRLPIYTERPGGADQLTREASDSTQQMGSTDHASLKEVAATTAPVVPMAASAQPLFSIEKEGMGVFDPAKHSKRSTKYQGGEHG